MHAAQIANDPLDIICVKKLIHKGSARLYTPVTQLGSPDLPNSVSLIGCQYAMDGLRSFLLGKITNTMCRGEPHKAL